MRRILAALLAALIILAGIGPAFFVPVAAQEPGEPVIPWERVIVPEDRSVVWQQLVIVPEWTASERQGGEVVELRGRVLWPDGLPVTGSPVLVMVGLPLAPDDQTARALDPVAIGQTNWRGEMICARCDPALSYGDREAVGVVLRIPHALVYPGERAIIVTGKIAILSVRTDVNPWLAGIVELPFTMTIVGGSPPFGVD